MDVVDFRGLDWSGDVLVDIFLCGAIESVVLNHSRRFATAQSVDRGIRNDAAGLLVAEERGKEGLVAFSYCVGVESAVLNRVSSVGISGDHQGVWKYLDQCRCCC